MLTLQIGGKLLGWLHHSQYIVNLVLNYHMCQSCADII